jgi:hypothetical protein
MRKSVVGIGMIAGPVLFLIQALLTPAIGADSSEMLENIATAGNSDTAALLAVLSMLGILAGLLYLRQLAGPDGLGGVAGGLAVAGLVIQPIWVGIEAGYAAVAATGTGAEQAALADAIGSSAAGGLAIAGAMAYAIGTLLLGLALARGKAVSPVLAVLIGIFPALMVAGFATGMNALLLAGGVAAVAGMAPVGLKVLGGAQGAATPAASTA